MCQKFRQDEIQLLKQKVLKMMDSAMDEIRKTHDSIELFKEMKFGQLGFTTEGRRDNIIEQVNQSFTILMSCFVAKHYFPEATYFSFALGNSSGRDMTVYDYNDKVIAEVEIFTAVKANNNGKLRKDVNRLRDAKTIADGCRRVVCYSAQKECKMKHMPGDEKVEVKYWPLKVFMSWIRK